jgi:quercetin 2,3-dioxygenase
MNRVSLDARDGAAMADEEVLRVTAIEESEIALVGAA